MNRNQWMVRIMIIIIVLSTSCDALAAPGTPTPKLPTLTPKVVEDKLHILTPEDTLRFDAEMYAKWRGWDRKFTYAGERCQLVAMYRFS
jgi:hypothetical protein